MFSADLGGVMVGLRIGLGWLGVQGWFRVGLRRVYYWFRVSLFRSLFREFCWFKVFLGFLSGWRFCFKIGSSFKWRSRVGLVVV